MKPICTHWAFALAAFALLFARPAAGQETKSAAELMAERQKLDATLWADEIKAQHHEATIVRLWDEMRNLDPFRVLSRFPFEQMAVGELGEPRQLDWGITASPLTRSPRKLSRDEAVAMLEQFRKDGWRIETTEWHHSRFEPAPPGTKDQPARSTVSATINLVHAQKQLRAALNGSLRVEWSDQRDEAGNPKMRSIDLTGMTLWQRQGEPMFAPLLSFNPRKDTKGQASLRTQPIFVYDLDGDGQSEVILGGCNRVLWNLGQGRFEQRTLCAQPIEMSECGVVADFDNDGVADLITVDTDRHPYLFRGQRGQATPFPGAPQRISGVKLLMPKVMTAGDIDGDGDLDLFIAQYKAPYLGGQMPTPYYDAKDGDPAYLYRNDGDGKFTDITEQAGLAAKRLRRTFSASLADLDDDGDLDLMVVSDFAGMDIHLNDGKGRFTDATDRMIDKRHAFGMAHSFGDYDGDGKLDFYMIGMGSTTARRLEQLGLRREDQKDRTEMRMAMGFGNRMYLRRGDAYQEPPFAAEVARTGWAWGVSTFDFDSDGDSDLYVANGHISGQSAKDYCTRYWCHDIYIGDSKSSQTMKQLFDLEISDTTNKKMSWNGFEKNKLLMNLNGKGFVDVAHLMGVAFEFDSRVVVSEDLDGDGRKELLVTQITGAAQAETSILHIYRNQQKLPHHWLGIRLREQGGGISPIGTHLTVKTAKRTHVARIVTGDSFSSQHAPHVHFGLGEEAAIEHVEVRWRDGKTTRISAPPVDRWMDVKR